MSPLQAALRQRDPNCVIRCLVRMRHKDRVKAVRLLRPQAVHTHAGYIFRALGLSLVTVSSRRQLGISSTLSPISALLRLLRGNFIQVAPLLALFRDALHASLPLTAPREIGPITYDQRGYRPGPHYIWTRRATFALRRIPLPPFTHYSKTIPEALASIPCARTRALLQACAKPWGGHRGAPAYRKETFIALRLSTRKILPLEIVHIIMFLVPPDVDYSVASIFIQ